MFVELVFDFGAIDIPALENQPVSSVVNMREEVLRE
jgi:hypothetical protein